LQIKSTIGPTGAADILNRAGVLDIDPQTMAEPPLDTWVSDDLTSPLAQNSGNTTGPQAEMQAAQTANNISQDQQAHTQKQQALAAEHAAKAQQEAHSNAQSANEQNQMHAIRAVQEQHKARMFAAQADLAERTAREKKVNPTPAAPKK
jgi:hypothetical protein